MGSSFDKNAEHPTPPGETGAEGVHPIFPGAGRAMDLLRKSGEFPMSYEELDDPTATVYEGI
jgi:hypothetical protein